MSFSCFAGCMVKSRSPRKSMKRTQRALGLQIDRDGEYLTDNQNEYIVSVDNALTSIYDNSLDDSSSYKNLDDLDVSMLNN